MRESNFELLRIVSMFFILTVHIIGIGLGFVNADGEIIKTNILAESFSIIGVNCFILISGFFGINFKIRALVNFASQIFFYSIIIPILFLFVFPKLVTPKLILISFFPFGHNTWWFVGPYLILYLIAPYLNIILETQNKKSLLIALLILTYINIYLGWLWRGSVNPTGYSVFQFIYLYFIGHFIRKHSKSTKINTQVSLYVAMSFLIYISSYLVLKNLGLVWFQSTALAYNNPLILLSSISFFQIFRIISIKSPFINKISGQHVFAVYLIHMHPLIHPILFLNIKKYFILPELSSLRYPFLILMALSIFFLSLYIDKFRHHITVNLTEKVSNLIEVISSKIYIKIFN